MEMQSEEVTKAQEDKEEKPLLKRFSMSSVKSYFKASKATWIFLAIIWVVFLAELLGTWIFDSGYGINQISPSILVKMGANNPFLVKYGQLHRLLLSNLLHANIMHIFGNSLVLIIFCTFVEAAFPLKIYLLVLIIGGIQANMFFDLIYVIVGSALQHTVVGSSASICAVMGMFVAQVIILHKMGESVKKGKCIAGLLVINLVAVSLQEHVSLLAHLGGFLSGMFFGLMVLPEGEKEEVQQLKKKGTIIFILFTVMLFGIWVF